ncbi:glycoside hydrolase family protein [Enterobacter hormaechei]|nr:glycoside hydrolase family protein [Enterobacter hormaechei]
MADIKERLRLYEGSLEYQKHLGYYRNGKFWVYLDSVSKPTIGYGHLVQKGEDFSNGLTPIEADILLAKDIERAKAEVRSLGLSTPDDWQDFLIIMTFQLGLGGVKKFKKMIEALKQCQWSEAVKQAKDSLWYRQTPNRVNAMIQELKNK